ncbi:MAG TPA: MFS transporter, partial [Pseudomonas sp.]|nr:MFS transporter [Pseudomonas sp.]
MNTSRSSATPPAPTLATLPAANEAHHEPDAFIEKGTPQFLRTALALFCGGFATFALL